MAHSHRPRTSTRQSSVARLTSIVFVLGGAVSTVAAQQAGSVDSIDPYGTGGPHGTEWGLGIGAISKREAYIGIKRETEVVPVLRFENQYVEFSGLGLEVKLPSLQLGQSSRIKFGIVGEAELSGYKPKDAAILAGMAERKSMLWVGAKAKWENELVDLSAELTADASGNSKGRKFSLGAEKEWHLGEHAMVVPYVTAHWLDKKYVDYYYGVTAAEATAGRAAYAGKGGVNVDIGVRAMYRFDKHHSVLLNVGVTRLAKPIKASPIVGRSTTNQVIMGYMYSF